MGRNTKEMIFMIQKYNLSTKNPPTIVSLEKYLKDDFQMAVYTSGKSLEQYAKMISEEMEVEFGIVTVA